MSRVLDLLLHCFVFTNIADYENFATVQRLKLLKNQRYRYEPKSHKIVEIDI